MKLVVAIVKPHRLDAVKEALQDLGVNGLTTTDVEGFGRQRGHTEIGRGRSEYADHGGVGEQPVGHRHTMPGPPAHAQPSRTSGQLVDQTGLAHSCLTDNEHRGRPTRDHARQADA